PAEPAPGRAGAAARRAGPRQGRLRAPHRGAPAPVGTRRLRERPERGDARPSRSPDVPARSAPGPPARAESRRGAEAVPLPDTRAGRDARAAQGDRARLRPPSAWPPRLVRDEDVPPLPAAALLPEAACRHGLDGRPLLPPGHRGARDARPPDEARR